MDSILFALSGTTVNSHFDLAYDGTRSLFCQIKSSMYISKAIDVTTLRDLDGKTVRTDNAIRIVFDGDDKGYIYDCIIGTTKAIFEQP
jgi:hypothetical protein